MRESGPDFDNESSLRAARKSLPFAKLVTTVLTKDGRRADICPFCSLEKSSGLVKVAIVSKKIERATVDAIEAIDIVKVVQASLTLKRQGANWVASCPFHSDGKHPSFNVHPAKNIFKCFGCKEGGGPIQFVRKIADLDFVGAVEKLAGENGIPIRYETHGEKTLWRCANADCASATSRDGEGLDEVGFVGALPLVTGGKAMSRKDAFKAYLKMADVARPLPAAEKPERFKPKLAAPEPVLPNPVIPPEIVAPEPIVAEPAADSEEELIWKCIEVIRKENKCSPALLQRRLKLGERVNGILAELEKRGFIGPAKGTKPRDILKLPKPRPQIIKIKIGDEIHEMDAAQPDGGKMDGEEFVAGDFAPQEPLPDGTLPGRAALEYFYSLQTLIPEDDDATFFKRGLVTATNLALGIVSSTEKNFDLLHQMADGSNPAVKRFEMHELLASGLWLPEDKKKKKLCRPNAQFCGYGQLGKKAKEDRRDKKDKILWGMSYPILIPYFDEAGKIFKLRPHKGGAPGATLCGANRLYIPRDWRKAPDVAERFFRVVICEGEFKAQAIWQTLGPGRTDGADPIGVCAIPGITYGKNYDMREELEAWLQSVNCEWVDVVFDDEDKSDKQEMRDRHEAVIWAQYLAASIARKLQINGRVAVLPKSWRLRDGKPDIKGKADWDGELAQIIHKKQS